MLKSKYRTSVLTVVSVGLLATAAYAVWIASWVHPCTDPYADLTCPFGLSC